jgi:CarD family transcriptional regulator
MLVRSIIRRDIISVNQGDHIHHPQHGIGKVESIRKRSFSGINGTRFAKIFFKRERITLMLRENQLDDTIRKPMGPTEAKSILDHVRNWTGKLSNSWKVRANKHQKKMEAGEPLSYAEVYKDLRTLQDDGSLSAADRQHLKQSSDLLAEELAVALGKTHTEALEQISQAAEK